MVVRKSGASANKEEMTREEKLRRRRREKERVKKKDGNGEETGSARIGVDGKPVKNTKRSKKDERSDILSDLKKGNVKVIGKKGALEEINPKARRGAEASSASSAFKL